MGSSFARALRRPASSSARIISRTDLIRSPSKKGLKVVPEVMIPLIGTANEFIVLRDMTVKIADEIKSSSGVDFDYMVGTMIEIPRAALVADEIAKEAEFFSFGTNDLTNAVKTQIWIAISIYVMVAIIRKMEKIELNLYTILQIFSVSLFEKVPIYQLLTDDSLQTFDCDSRNQLKLFEL